MVQLNKTAISSAERYVNCMTNAEALKTIKLDQQSCFIMRGLPGSGKSTLAKEITKLVDTKTPQWGASICSQDEFRMVDGKYVFKPSNKPAQECLKKFCRNVGLASPLILDCTNTKLKAWEKYADIALAHGYQVFLVTMVCCTEIAKNRNTHGVPANTIDAMHNSLTNSTEINKVAKFCNDNGILQVVVDN